MPKRSLLPALAAFLVLLALASGCGDSSSASGPTYPDAPRTVFGGDRPVTLTVPASYDPATAVPLLVVLHGYGATGLVQSLYLGIDKLVESEGFLLLAPDGLVDPVGSHYWNATPACCDFARSGVDDVAYLRGLIDDVSHEYNVDPRRVFLMGHSNGGFMAHRLACEAADQVAAIVSLAGSTFDDAAACEPSRPVSVLDIHGTEDDTVRYGGGQIGGNAYPGALETLARWQANDGCDPGPIDEPGALDLDRQVSGDETTIQRYVGCSVGTDVELWTMKGAGHIPTPAAGFATLAWRWLADHARR